MSGTVLQDPFYEIANSIFHSGILIGQKLMPQLQLDGLTEQNNSVLNREEDEELLTEEELAEIKASIAEIEQGNYKTQEQMKEKYGL